MTDIDKVAIFGNGIAHVFALNGYDVLPVDIHEEFLKMTFLEVHGSKALFPTGF
jgi:3-hydroxyacyl-CoA dehydrogenase